MTHRTVDAADFEAMCLTLIDEVRRDGISLVVTQNGKPAAMLCPVPAVDHPRSPIGALRGTVSGFDDAITPAVPAEVWSAMP